MTNDVKCLRLAAKQSGVIRRDQALKWLSAQQLQRRLDAGAWVSVLPCVFRVEGAPHSWLQDLKAIALWAGRGFAFSHQTAAALHGFRRYPEGPLVVSVSRHLAAPANITLVRVKPLKAKDVEVVKGLKVTKVLRTLVDLAALAPQKDVRAATDEALSRKWITVEDFATAVGKVKKARGVAFLRTLVGEYQGGDGPCESELESVLFELLDAAELPRPIRQRVVKIGDRVRRTDFCFEDFGVVVEADSFAYHSSPMAFEKDRQRYNSLTARGFKVLQWTWTAIQERPDELLKELATVLASRVSWKLRQAKIS